jgi:S-adenosylmethionine:diacylglycerol 3-amino-3-carboxypropyl transferase
VRIATASGGIAGIVCAMLMLHHATVIIVRMRTAHCAIHYLRFGDLRRQSEGEDCSDNARYADAVTDHVSKLQSVVAPEVGETPLTW